MGGTLSPMRRGWVVVWVVMLCLQAVVLYTPDVGGGTGVLASLWEVTRGWPGSTAPGEYGFDWIIHATSFASVTAAGLLCGWPTWFAVGLPLVHAPVSEFIQWAWVPGRTGDARDVAADVVGTLVAWAVVALWMRNEEDTDGGRDEDRGGARLHQARSVPETGRVGR